MDPFMTVAKALHTRSHNHFATESLLPEWSAARRLRRITHRGDGSGRRIEKRTTMRSNLFIKSRKKSRPKATILRMLSIVKMAVRTRLEMNKN